MKRKGTELNKGKFKAANYRCVIEYRRVLQTVNRIVIIFIYCNWQWFWGDLGVDGWIILGCMSRRWDVGIWTALGWPMIETGGGRL